MATSSTPSSRHYDVIILGAGIAGLACASRLHQHPRFKQKNTLLVLEARDRIGGRISSIKVNGCRLDTGANWIHGIGTEEEPNPLVKILPDKKYREIEGGVSFRAPDKSGENVSSNQEGDDWVKVDASDLVIPDEFSGPLNEARWGTIGELHELAASIPPDDAKSTSILQAMSKLESFKESFGQLPEELHSTLRGLPQFIENMEAAPLTKSSSEKPRGAPGVSLAEFAIDDFDGDQVFLRDGYTAVVDEVAKDLASNDLIELSTEVKSIHWNKSLIEISTTKGTFTAIQIICTLPLGVLQHSHKQLFNPPLPSQKQNAISSLGFGTLDKIFLVYNKPWWEAEPFTSIITKGYDPSAEDPSHPDTFSGFTTELQGLSISPSGEFAPGPRLISFMNLQNLTGFPVLSAFVSCANATQVETMTDSDAEALLHRSLTSWFGVEPPRPEAVHVTRWAQDQYSRGSYSHMITGLSEHAHREEFQKPVRIGGGDRVLRFAGEHTSRNHFATVHGALLSGWREADQIIKELVLAG